MTSDISAILGRKVESRIIMQDMAELFQVQDKRNITRLLITNLHENMSHPFKVVKDEKLDLLAKSIEKEGLIQPIIVRPLENGIYEILSGHRRTVACRKNGMKEIDAIIVEVDDELAHLIMISSNFQQRDILPSEQARSYKLRYDDLTKRKKAQDKNSNGWNPLENKIEKIMETEFGTSKSKVYMYLRLNYLIEKLLDKLDAKKLKLRIATELSYLRAQEQETIYEMVYEKNLFGLTLSKAVSLKKRSSEGGMTRDDIWDILASDALVEKDMFVISGKDLARYREKFEDKEAMRQAILQFLEEYIHSG